MALHVLRILRFAAVPLLAGLCASGTCSVVVSTDHDCCDHCDDCNDCGDCDGSCCDDFDDLASAPPPLAVEAFVVDEAGGVHRVWAVVAPAGGVELLPPSR
jgi:hypothetical protein